MKSHHDSRPDTLKIRENELVVSGAGLIDLIKSVLERNVSFRFRAKGDSMVPFIRHDDIVTISPLHNSLPHIGNIVAFAYQGKLIIHRIIKRRGYYFLLKGDNLPHNDGFIHKSDIIGYVTKIERKGKEIFLGLGIERFIIVILARWGSFYNLVFPFWKLIRPFVRH